MVALATAQGSYHIPGILLAQSMGPIRPANTDMRRAALMQFCADSPIT
jgi:hypothetical protein